MSVSLSQSNSSTNLAEILYGNSWRSVVKCKLLFKKQTLKGCTKERQIVFVGEAAQDS